MDVDASHFDQNEPVNANNALMQEKLGALAAFHRWRHSQLVNRFRRSLQDLASEVEEAETQAESQRQELSTVKESHQEALTINVQLSSDLESALRQLDATRNDLAQCRGEVDMQERASKIAQEESARLRLAVEAAMKGKEEERNARRAESEGLKEQHSALLQQQQQLMTQLSQRDAKVVELSAESKRFQSRIEALELEARQLRAESNKMGERASAAEASSKASLASEAKMRSELDALRVSYLKDLSELKAARISRSEVSALKEQLESAQRISSSMVKARDEIRVNLDICSSQLVSAEEKLRRQSSFVSLKEQLIKMASQQGASTNDSAVVEVLSAELEAKMEEISLLAAKTASLNAILTQSQAQVERLAQEKSELAGSLDLESVKRRHLASLVAELQAEMQRMVAESSLPPLEQRAEGSSPSDQPVAAAKAPAPLSTMETQTTALRVLIATKLPSFHDLEARLSPLLPNEANLKSSPLSSLPQAMTQLEVVMRESRTVSNSLEGLSELLGSRPVPIQTLIDALGSTRSSLDSAALLSFASNSDEMQLDLVSLDGKLQGAEEVLQHASSLLACWTSLMSQMMGQGRAVDEALRQRIKSELVAVEESIHSTLMKLSSPETHQGGIVKVEVELALRGVQNSVMELSNLIASDRDAVPDSRARSHAQHCETLAKEKTAVVSRHRSQLAKVPGFIGSVSSCAQACAEDEFVLIEGIDSMLDLLRQLQDKAKGEAPIDPVVLQGEIYALRSQLKLMDKMVKELKEAASAALGSSDASKPRVPFEAMQALTQAHDSAVEERSKLRAAMATQRMRMANGRLVFVEYFESLRSSSLAFLSFAVWREQAAQERARRAQELADKTQASLDSIILTCTSRRSTALEAVERITDDRDIASLIAIIRGWRIQATRQAKACRGWGVLCQILMEERDRVCPPHPDGSSVASRMWRRRRIFGGPLPPAPYVINEEEEEEEEGGEPFKPRLPSSSPFAELWLSFSPLASLTFRAWRSLARLTFLSRQAEHLTSSVPVLVERIGERRREERAWLAWRLFCGSRRVLRAEAVADDRDELQEDLHRMSDLWRQEQEKQQRRRQREEEEKRMATRASPPAPTSTQLVVIPTHVPSVEAPDDLDVSDPLQFPHVHTLMSPSLPPPAPPPPPAPIPPPAALKKRSISAGGVPLSSASTAASAAREAANKHRALIAQQQMQREALLRPTAQPADAAKALHSLAQQINAARVSLSSPPRNVSQQPDLREGERELQLALEEAGWQPFQVEKGPDPILTSPGRAKAGGDSIRVSFIPNQTAQWERLAASLSIEEADEPAEAAPVARSLPPPPPTAAPPGISLRPPPPPRASKVPPQFLKHEAKQSALDTVATLAKRKDMSLQSNLLALPRMSKDDVVVPLSTFVDPLNKPTEGEVEIKPVFVPPPALSHTNPAAQPPASAVVFVRKDEGGEGHLQEACPPPRTFIRLPQPARFNITEM